MTRSTDPDLFDFLGRSSRPARGARAVTSARAAHRAEAAGYEDPALARRRRLLVGAATALLVVLAFVAGIAVGRGKRTTDGVPLVGGAAGRAEVVETWILKGRPLPKVSPVGQDDVETRLLRAMKQRYPSLDPYLASGPVEVGRGQVAAGSFRLVARGFQSEASATAWAKVLSRERVGEYQPFQDCRPERVAEKGAR